VKKEESVVKDDLASKCLGLSSNPLLLQVCKRRKASPVSYSYLQSLCAAHTSKEMNC
jgi:hypothetical protein